jgi:hypothetical protein
MKMSCCLEAALFLRISIRDLTSRFKLELRRDLSNTNSLQVKLLSQLRSMYFKTWCRGMQSGSEVVFLVAQSTSQKFAIVEKTIWREVPLSADIILYFQLDIEYRVNKHLLCIYLSISIENRFDS